MRITYLAETEEGQIGYEEVADNIDYKRAARHIRRDTGNSEAYVFDSVTDDDPLYDKIVESWGVDVL